jgi:hypothetical protein
MIGHLRRAVADAHQARPSCSEAKRSLCGKDLTTAQNGDGIEARKSARNQSPFKPADFQEERKRGHPPCGGAQEVLSCRWIPKRALSCSNSPYRSTRHAAKHSWLQSRNGLRPHPRSDLVRSWRLGESCNGSISTRPTFTAGGWATGLGCGNVVDKPRTKAGVAIGDHTRREPSR